jgi:RNA polymerase sigma factor (sigma-70 family)
VNADARAKFDRLIPPCLGDGFKLARWLLGNPADAEDAVQEACLRAFLGMDRLVEHNVRAWFLTIVRNTCYSWLEQHRPGILLSSEQLLPHDQRILERGGPSAEPVPTLEDTLIAKDDAFRLAEAIDRLPLPMREVLVLREYHGLSYKEIAEVSGAPVGTVMSRLARARQHLMLRFERDGDGS